VQKRQHRHLYQSKSKTYYQASNIQKHIKPTPNEVWIEYFCVEDGMPHFANSVAKKAARLRTRVSELL
jgi:hypothetical protein